MHVETRRGMAAADKPTPYTNSLTLSHTPKQVDYILTAGGPINPKTGKPKFSYLIGFGDKSPRAPHHRSSSCDGEHCDCSRKAHPHVLYGALVGGPGEKDDWVDDCADYQRNVSTWVGRTCLRRWFMVK